MRNAHIFEDLYKKDSKGKLQKWSISVGEVPEGFVIVTQHGKVGGKIQEARDVITEGKNIGKANETTPEQQALAEAEARWKKQQERKGYVINPEDCDKDLRPGAEPMLAHRYDKYPDKIKFPAFAQPKLDGHRCIAIVDKGKAQLFSRQRKPITGLPHIERALESLIAPDRKVILDGELYNHELKHEFERLTGYIRSEKPKKGHEVVSYCIYDTINGKAFYDRQNEVRRLFDNRPSIGPLVHVPTPIVDDETAALSLFRVFRDEGYEGLMLRNLEGVYVGKRSYDLQKVKEFNDEEFEVVGVTEGRGKMKGHAIFECVTSEGHKFEAKMMGSMDKLVEYFKNPEKCIGRRVTVRFQGYTTKNNVPRFPVAVRFREDV